MKSLWLAYLFSIRCQGSLKEFLTLETFLREGISLDDPYLEELSMTWKEIKMTLPHLRGSDPYERFVQYIEERKEKGICFIHPAHPDFPVELQHLHRIPFFLSYRGCPLWKNSFGLAIVGSREPSSLSEAWCERELPILFKSTSLFSVSGGARGIDQMAHRISIRSQTPTAVFLPSGLNAIYPTSLLPLQDLILESGGVLISEYLPEIIMKKHHFQRRNRLIIGLAKICLIVEAGQRSGTLITANQAIEQNKPILILPSHPYDRKASGGLNLLLEGATPVRDAQDLILLVSAEMK